MKLETRSINKPSKSITYTLMTISFTIVFKSKNGT